MELNKEVSPSNNLQFPLRLDVFILRTHVDETNDRLYWRAAELASAMAKMNGWGEVTLKKSDIPVLVERRYLCHFFEIWSSSSDLQSS